MDQDVQCLECQHVAQKKDFTEFGMPEVAILTCPVCNSSDVRKVEANIPDPD